MGWIECKVEGDMKGNDAKFAILGAYNCVFLEDVVEFQTNIDSTGPSDDV